jgi:hypothetical protein
LPHTFSGKRKRRVFGASARALVSTTPRVYGQT